MDYVEITEQCNVSLPTDILHKANLQTGDKLGVREENGVIILTPRIHKKSSTHRKNSLLNLLGANKGSGLYQDAKDADNYIRNLRDEWN